MTIGIYSITHRDSGKRYIGKSINIESRLWQHKNLLTKPERSKDCNRHLYNAVQKYGWETFCVETIEEFDWIDDDHIAARELFWMDHFQTCDRRFGYNLRRDSSTKMEVHAETRAIQSIQMRGEGNPNFANYWSDDMKSAMSEITKRRHCEGFYGDEWRRKHSVNSTALWSDLERRRSMTVNVSATKQQKYDFIQYDRAGNFIRRWYSVEEIVAENPAYKWQNIYSVCNGYKPTYMGSIWRKVPSAATESLLISIAVAA